MKNIVVYGFESKPAVDVLLRLQQEKIINIAKWYYDEDLADERLNSYPVACKHTSLWRGPWEQVDKFPNEQASKYILDQMDWLMQEYARDTEFLRESFYEYKNILWHMVNEFYSVLNYSDVDCVFFSDVPHGNSSATLYVTARSLGVDTLYVSNIGSFPDRFIYAHTVEEYGDFDDIPVYQDAMESVHIEEKFEKEIFYMTEEAIKADLKMGWGRKLKILSSPHVWWNNRKKIIEKSFEKHESISDFFEHKITHIITKRFWGKVFERNIKRYVKYDVDLQKKFVYFPLHLQPEMTTDAIGGVYRDQLLAIEQLRRILPNDWYIYVKENPKQKYECRGKYFYKRLATIPNVYYVARSIDTYELMRHSQFVATITGTAGYEAITGGKPAVVFGRGWYKSLPGVFLFEDDLRIEDVTSCVIKHDELEKRLANLLKKTGKGVWRQPDLDKIPNLEEKKNYIELYSSFRFLFTHCVNI